LIIGPRGPRRQAAAVSGCAGTRGRAGTGPGARSRDCVHRPPRVSSRRHRSL